MSLSLPSVGLLLCAPAAASVFAAIACPHHCHCWLPMSLAMATIAATVAAETAGAATMEHLDISPG
jgi:hypothetical protein